MPTDFIGASSRPSFYPPCLEGCGVARAPCTRGGLPQEGCSLRLTPDCGYLILFPGEPPPTCKNCDFGFFISSQFPLFLVLTTPGLEGGKMDIIFSWRTKISEKEKQGLERYFSVLPFTDGSRNAYSVRLLSRLSTITYVGAAARA